MTIAESWLSVVTGIPASGKSEFIDAIAVNLAMRHSWRFALCSFENPPEHHLSKLAEKYLGLPFWDGPRQRMTEAELRRAMDWLADYFHLIRFDDEVPTIEAILDKAAAAVVRHGIRGLVIDPYNEIEHRRPVNMSETEYVSQILGRVRRFADNHGLHIWFVAHPRIMRRDKADGPFPVPTLYDISGSANWANKADIGVGPPARADGRHDHRNPCPQGPVQIRSQAGHRPSALGSQQRPLRGNQRRPDRVSADPARITGVILGGPMRPRNRLAWGGLSGLFDRRGEDSFYRFLGPITRAVLAL